MELFLRKNFSPNLSFLFGTFQKKSFAMINIGVFLFEIAIFKSQPIIFIICALIIFFLGSQSLILRNSEYTKKIKKRVIIFLEMFNAFSNIFIMAFLVDEPSELKTFHDYFQITALQIAYLYAFHSNYIKVFALFSFSAFISFKFQLQTEEIVFLFLSDTIFSLSLLPKKKRNKNSTLFILPENAKKKSLRSNQESSSSSLLNTIKFFMVDVSDDCLVFDNKKNLLFFNDKVEKKMNEKKLNMENIFELYDNLKISFPIKFEKSDLGLRSSPSLVFSNSAINLRKNRSIKLDEIVTDETNLNYSLSFPIFMEEIYKLNDETNYIAEAPDLNGNKQNFYVLKLKKFILVRIKQSETELELQYFKKHLKTFEKTLHYFEHEFRTSLNCVVTMVQALEGEVCEDLIETHIAPSITSTKFLLHLIDDIMDIFSFEINEFKLKISQFNLELLLKDTMDIIEVQTKQRGLDLFFDHDRRIASRIKSDPNRIRQIVVNLLGKLQYLD